MPSPSAWDALINACPHDENDHVGRVSWPPDLTINNQTGEASTYVCDRADCQERAAAAVALTTRRRGVFVAFTDQQATRSA